MFPSQKIQNILQQKLSKKSKIDWRFLIVISLVLYFSLILFSSFFTNYYQFWKVLGVPALYPSFIDIRGILSGFECTRLGYDVFIENPCDPLGRAVFYPRIWWTFSLLNLGTKHTDFLGISFALIFYYCNLKLMGKTNYYEAILYSAMLCSPAVMLLVERCNTDIIIFSLFSVALMILNSSQRPITNFFSYTIILFSGFLKMFPIFGLTIILRERKKISLFFSIGFSMAFLSYLYINWKELSHISRAAKADYRYFTYGWKTLFYHVKQFLLNFSLEFFDSPNLLEHKIQIFELIVGLALFIYASLLAYKMLAKILQDFQEFRHRSFQIAPDRDRHKNDLRLDGFRLGSSIYIGTFLLGSVHDYKLAFLLLAIPQILAWIKTESKMSLPSSLALTGIVVTLYLGRLSIFNLDEAVNWFLLGYFLYGFFVSLPAWTKQFFHHFLARPIEVR